MKSFALTQKRLFPSNVFFYFWICVSASNLGTWLHEVGASWLMTSATTSPSWMGWLLASEYIPVIILAPIAGSLLDRTNLRMFLIVSQSWMLLIAASLAVLATLSLTSPIVLLILSFLLAIGAAASSPAFHAMLPHLVEKKELHSAISTYYTGFSIGRALGPAIAGLIISTLGTPVVFFLNSVSFAAVITFLLWWRPPIELQRRSKSTASLQSHLSEGIRFVLGSLDLKAVFVEVFLFTFGGTCLWTLIPLLARHELKMNSGDFGFLMGLLGLGAIWAGILLSLKIEIHATQRIRRSSVALMALAMFFFSLGELWFCRIGAVLAGVAWIAFVSTSNSTTQSFVASPLRGRIMSLYVAIFFLGMALGSVAWSQLAAHIGIERTFLAVSWFLFLQFLIFSRLRFLTFPLTTIHNLGH
jgi:MFS family permease